MDVDNENESGKPVDIKAEADDDIDDYERKTDDGDERSDRRRDSDC